MSKGHWGDLPDVLQEVERLAGRNTVLGYFTEELRDLEVLGDLWLDNLKDDADLERCGLFRSNVTYGAERLFNKSLSSPCVSIVRAWEHYNADMTHDAAVQKMKLALIALLPAIDALALLGDCCAD